MKRLRIGTRGSLLARAQTQLVVQRLQDLYPDGEITVEVIQTTGDRQSHIPFAQVGTKGMFVREIEEALLAGRIEVGVHSMKDLPGTLPPGLTIACIPERADPRDALLLPLGRTLADLPPNARIGTSSARRQAQIRHWQPDWQLHELRGNLDTRLRKLDSGEYDAIVLACAGLERLGLADRITLRLEPDLCLPPPGQGALALEIRTEDLETASLLQPLHDPNAADTVAAERAFQAALGGGCTVPLAAFATLQEDTLTLRARLLSPDGIILHEAAVSGSRTLAASLGTQLALLFPY